MGQMNTAQLHYVEVMCESLLHGLPDIFFIQPLTYLLFRGILRTHNSRNMVAHV